MIRDFSFHLPVMVEEAVEFLAVKRGRVYVDGTLGGGGHTATVLRKSQIQNPKSKIKIIGIDQDIEAIKFAKKRLKKYASNLIFVHNNFKNLDDILDQLKISKVDGILLDLGVSSHQIDELSRGFSFKEGADVKLDMRMDPNQKFSAVEVVNDYSEEDLRKIFFEYGEEKFSKSIAREIVKRRREKEILTADDLVKVIKSATPPKYRYSRQHHFATKIFQALRIEVNQELEALRQILPQAVERLNKNGRLVVISFHSLEDRIVKHFFREMKNEEKAKILTKKPLTPTKEEITLNPKAKSAKLRAIEKI